MENIYHMGIGVSIFWIAVGAVLRFAVNVESSAIDLHTVGDILMVVGIIGIGVSIAFWHSWGGFGRYRRSTTIEQRTGDPLL